jgi:hypothetical protein
MAAPSRTGPLQRHWELQLTARLQERSRVLLPSVLVEVNRKEEARLILQHGVHAGHKRLAGVVVAGQVPADDVVGDREKASVVTLRALDARLLADATGPLVRTGRGVAGLASLAALEASRVDVFATPKQRAEEGDLVLRRGLLVDVNLLCSHCSVLADQRPAAVVAFIRVGCRSSGVAGGAG